jgi:LmbE family N-acetylglucosaminyl deacetylase
MDPGSTMRTGTTSGQRAGALRSSHAVVVSPHLDDAVLSCWHALARPQVRRVVTVFAGLPAAGTTPSAWDVLTRSTDPRRRVLQRRAEDRRALRDSGCAPVHLGFVGAAHRSAPLDVAAVRAAVAAAVGAAGTVYVPAAVGGHPDHVAARDAALAAGAGRRQLLYADQPYAVRFGWPPWVAGDAEAELDVDGWLAAQLATVPGGLAGLADPVVHRLPAPAHAAKVRAIGAHRSQVAALAAAAGDDFPHGPRWAYEVVWPVLASATGCLPGRGSLAR